MVLFLSFIVMFKLSTRRSDKIRSTAVGAMLTVYVIMLPPAAFSVKSSTVYYILMHVCQLHCMVTNVQMVYRIYCMHAYSLP